jgi:DNA-binding Lrp family transcriptional regulator
MCRVGRIDTWYFKSIPSFSACLGGNRSVEHLHDCLDYCPFSSADESQFYLQLFQNSADIEKSLIAALKVQYHMPTAYVLINCDLGSEEEILKELRKLPEVIEVSGVYGVYDIILKIKSETMDKLRETITWHVRRIDKVRSTLTMIVIEGQGEKGKRPQLDL